MRISLLAAILATAIVTPAAAAFITIDDSDPDTITITAGDFEDGFFVDGDLLTVGIGESGTITLLDGSYDISGNWIDNGDAQGTSLAITFALPSAPDEATSGITFSATSDGVVATLTGIVDGFTGSPYFTVLGPTFPQDGRTETAFVPFLTVAFISEAAAVPAPAALGLFGLGLGALALRRRAI